MFTEQQLIREIRRRFADASLPVGIGDDAAIADLPSGSSTVMCADMLVEGTHFRRSTHPADSVGFKSIAVNVSDIGAMGGVPAFALLSIALPSDVEMQWIGEFLNGVARACGDFQVRLVGGDSAAASSIFIDVSLVGHIPRGSAVKRSGARVGDGIFVTGALGGAAAGLRLLEEGISQTDARVQRQLRPIPRYQIGRTLTHAATAMIDVSDGFSIDLGHILDESGVDARIEEGRIPRAPGADMDQALHGGEDYELIITGTDFPPVVDGIPLTRVGEITKPKVGGEIRIVSDSGIRPLVRKGWQHF